MHPTPTRLLTAFGREPERTRLKKAVFLDRDGVLIKDEHYLADPSKVSILPGVVEGLKRLSAEFRLIIVTNQSGVARGIFSIERLEQIHQILLEQFCDRGVAVDAVYYCPHLAQGSVASYAVPCSCRKPSPGMLLQAMEELDLRAEDCFMVGDQETDVGAGHAAGVTPLLVAPDNRKPTNAAFVCTDLGQASRYIIGQAGSQHP
jgi:D-glycero-D-manno-heptose 1,7-bisphosphate phosphatase